MEAFLEELIFNVDMKNKKELLQAKRREESVTDGENKVSRGRMRKAQGTESSG